MAPGVSRRFSLTLNLGVRPLSISISNPTTPRSPLGSSSLINSPAPGSKITKLTKRGSRKARTSPPADDDGHHARGGSVRSHLPTPSPQPSSTFLVHTPLMPSPSSSWYPLLPSDEAVELGLSAETRATSHPDSTSLVVDTPVVLHPMDSIPSPSSARGITIPSPLPPSEFAPPATQLTELDANRASLVPSAVADDGMSVISGLVVPLTDEVAEERRIAKLTRHLGEPITADLLCNSTEPAPALTSPRFGTRRFTRPQSMARRLSLDMSTLMQPLLSPDRDRTMTSTPPSGATMASTPSTAKSTTGMKRSRSLWARRRLPSDVGVTQSLPGEVPMQSGLLEGQWMASAGERLRPAASPLPERHRVMNVKRAKKMAEVFGSEPPASLFQIKRIDLSTEALLMPPTPRRASISTFFTDDGLRTPTSEKRGSLLTVSTEGRRSSTITIVSLSSSDVRHSRRHSSILPGTPTIEANQANMLPRSPPLSPRPTALDSIRHLSIGPPPEPPSPAPFSDIPFSNPFVPTAPVPTLLHAPPTEQPRRVSEPDDIWMRRRRAQKLGQFFGVETREIPSATFDLARAVSPVMTAPHAPSPPPATDALVSVFDADEEPEHGVRIEVQGGSRLWGMRRQNSMRQAMVTLREMRAS